MDMNLKQEQSGGYIQLRGRAGMMKQESGEAVEVVCQGVIMTAHAIYSGKR